MTPVECRTVYIPPSVKRDVLILPALFLLNCFFFSAWLRLASVATEPWLLLVWLYGLAVLVPLAWRDRAPMVVFAIQWLLTVAAWPIMPLFTPVTGIPVALYAVAVHRTRKFSLLALAASLIPTGLGAAVALRVYSAPADQLRSFVPNVVLLLFVTAAAWGAGRVSRASRRHVQNLERERETVREAVDAERRRIACELHDIVSHAVTVIVLQAAGAARIVNTDIAQVTRSLECIETTGKQAMAELRRLLGVLRAGDPASPAPDELGPQPGLSEVTALLSSLRAAGMAVAVDVEGTPRSLDPSVDLAGYRIVQEGLTNVLKHAGKDSTPRLRLVWMADSLLLQVDNDSCLEGSHGRTALSVGRGLAGLRERAHAVGGRLHAGRHNGRYQLTAILPLPDTVQRTPVDQHQ